MNSQRHHPAATTRSWPVEGSLDATVRADRLSGALLADLVMRPRDLADGTMHALARPGDVPGDP